jgi:hypothetical protein
MGGACGMIGVEYKFIPVFRLGNVKRRESIENAG